MNKVLALVMLLVLPSATVDCGVLIHPERNGHRSGPVDAGALIMDCLWLLVGVVPGVVALVVDFSTGGVYASGSAMAVAPGQALQFRLRGSAPRDAAVAVTIQSPDGHSTLLLDRHVAQGGEIGPLSFSIPAELAPGRYSLALMVNGQAQSAWGLNVASAQE